MVVDLSTLDPATFGYLGWSFPPFAASNAVSAGTGILRGARIPLGPGQKTITNLCCGVGAAGATLTANENLGAIFDNAFNLLGITADQSTAWEGTGAFVMPLADGPITGNWPWVYGAVLCNGTTAPKFDCGPTQTTLATGTADTAHSPFVAQSGGLTAIPQQFAAAVASLIAVWLGVS